MYKITKDLSKYIYLFWDSHNLPVPMTDMSAGGGNKGPDAAELGYPNHAPLINFGFGGQPLAQITNYNPDVSVPLASNPFIITTSLGANDTHYQIDNLTLTTSTPCGSGGSTFSLGLWGSQSNYDQTATGKNNTPIQCGMSAPAQLFLPTITTAFHCGAPYTDVSVKNTFDLNIAYGTPTTFNYNVYVVDALGNHNNTTDLVYSGSTTTTAGNLNVNLANVPYPQSRNFADLLEKQKNLVVEITSPSFGSQVITSAITNNCAQLPVTFGAISATIKTSGQLVVNWQSLTEENVDRYVVEASIDGKNWKEIGTQELKVGGNSTATVNYQLVVGLPVSFAVIGFAIILLFPAFRSRKTLMLALLIVIGTIFACTDTSKEVDVSKVDVMYIRIAQYDKGSDKPQLSPVQKVIKE